MKKILVMFMALFMLAACSKDSDSFKGKMYKLTSAPTNMEITIGFDDNNNRFFGKALNNYFGTYTIEGTDMVFGAIATTMMAGPEEMMSAESNYLGFLPNVSSFKLDGKKLSLIAGSGDELVFEETGKVPAPQE